MDQFKERNAFVKSDALNDYDDLNTRQRNWSLENYDLSTWGNSKAKNTVVQKQESRQVTKLEQTKDEQIVIKLRKPTFEKSTTNTCSKNLIENKCVEYTQPEEVETNCGCNCDDEVVVTLCPEETVEETCVTDNECYTDTSCTEETYCYEETDCNEETDCSEETVSCETVETVIKPKPVFSSTQNMLAHFINENKCAKCARPCKMYYMTANNQYNITGENVTQVQNNLSNHKNDSSEVLENTSNDDTTTAQNTTENNVIDDVDNRSGYENQIIEL